MQPITRTYIQTKTYIKDTVVTIIISGGKYDYHVIISGFLCFNEDKNTI